MSQIVLDWISSLTYTTVYHPISPEYFTVPDHFKILKDILEMVMVKLQSKSCKMRENL